MPGHVKWRQQRPLIVVFLIVSYVIAGCAGFFEISDTYDGITAGYERGEPAFDIRVRPQSLARTRGLVVDVSAPEISVSFQEKDGALGAQIEWLVRLYDGNGKRVIDEKTGRNTLSRIPSHSPSLFRYARHSVFFEVSPGKYFVEVFLDDLLSGKTAIRRLKVEYPARNRPLIVTQLTLDYANGSPILGTQIPLKDEAFASTYFLTGNTARPVRSETVFLRLVSDSTAARSPFWQGPDPAEDAITRNPIVSDTLIKTTETFSRGPLRAVQTPLRVWYPGLYKIEVVIDDLVTEGAPPAATLSRYMVFRRESFPELNNYSELIPPLIYLADANEWEIMRNVMVSGNPRPHFDSFWGRFMEREDLALVTLRAYFTRVEEANLRFSILKEGWKTDRGMIYILLGEPLFIDRSSNREVWFYSFDDGRSDESFTFIRNQRSFLPEILQPFKLQRSSDYEPFWRREIQRWRTGRAIS